VLTFTRHGIDHVSPSSLNLWRASPGLWSARYLAGIRDDGSAAMWRGTAVEVGLRHVLYGTSIDKAHQAAIDSFETNALGLADDNVAAERALVFPMLDQAAKWKPPSALAATQIRVEHWFRDVPVPVIGFVDFAFLDGLDVDLKNHKILPVKTARRSRPPSGALSGGAGKARRRAVRHRQALRLLRDQRRRRASGPRRSRV
jgi:hypothetical protein